MKLEFQDIQKSFGAGAEKRVVLDGITKSISFPHVLALLGPSGGGKSTLLRLIAGLEHADTGRIVLDGVALPESEASLLRYRRSLGVVFQAFNLFPHMTALQNVVLPLTEVHGMEKSEAHARALEVLTRLGLADHAEKKPALLSGGQRQRVAIARALAAKPRLLLFDEPTSALDPEMTAEVLELIAELKDSGTPMLLVTHEMGFARKIADQVAFLSDGKLLEVGAASEFFNQPQTLQASRFLEKVLAF